jgi:hypothetical protein
MTEHDSSFALVEPDDAKECMTRKWHVTDERYAAASFKGRKWLMHRLIMRSQLLGCWEADVDHINHNRLDNRHSNLRVCTRYENNYNKIGRTNEKMQGVARVVGGGYTASICSWGESTYLGKFDTSEEAAKAYDKAARDLHGSFASLNYPDVVNDSAQILAAVRIPLNNKMFASRRVEKIPRAPKVYFPREIQLPQRMIDMYCRQPSTDTSRGISEDDGDLYSNYPPFGVDVYVEGGDDRGYVVDYDFKFSEVN